MAVWVGYIALFGIAVEAGVVMVVYLHEALQHGLLTQRRSPKLTSSWLLLTGGSTTYLAPTLWESGIGSNVMKTIAAPIVGGMIPSTIHVLILVPVFFLLLKRRALRKGELEIVKQRRAATERCEP